MMKTQAQEMRRIRTGRVFKNGKFYKFDSTAQRITVVRAWPAPMCWVKELKGSSSTHWKAAYPLADFDGWVNLFRRRHSLKSKKAMEHEEILQPYLPTMTPVDWGKLARRYVLESEGQLPLPFNGSQAVHGIWAVVKLFSDVPQNVTDILIRMPFNRWHMLQLLARCGPAAEDLVYSNELLAFCLANGRYFNNVKNLWRSVRSLLKKKQRYIAGWLGFGETEQVIKILRQIDPKVISKIKTLRYLRSALQDKAALKLFSHMSGNINADVLRIITDSDLRDSVSIRLLEEIASKAPKSRFYRYAYTLRDTIRMNDEFINPNKPLKLQSLKQLNNFHEDRVDTINRRQLDVSNIKFPQPPFRAFENEGLSLHPIETPEALIQEGKEMNICCGSSHYLMDVARSRGYFFRVMRPQRATAFFKLRDGTCQLAEIKGHSNEDVPAAREAILKWCRTSEVLNVSAPITEEYEYEEVF